ncbi:biotin--[acetyl-CoA-carboxylase] ligase [Erythrobacter sp. GH1-10]|uniref:biotin--[acetyl-CoA-carboxylase] ligase n=1 Tax=Erythrobacter sp. GH1-10 TaxID=3349334 RepID=UPI0038783CC5
MASKVKYVAETGSTNADILEALQFRQKFDEGYWLITDRQTAGRGRQGRVWSDGAGNFMGSTVVTLQSGEYPGTSLNLPISMAVRAALAEFVPDPAELMLKWPNDVLLRGAKVSGILMELHDFQVVVGIGVNIASAPEIPGRTTISVSDVTDNPPSRDSFAKRLMHHVANEIARWRSLGETGVRARWLGYAHPKGTHLIVHDREGDLLEGDFEGLTSGGALQLKTEGGKIVTVHSGDILIRD